ncbi:MAG: ABC transporter ATP-binding protein [SAR86 cluster bacterium]|uniref:ABC transporter ATP-binding protein n=1 Tax=SAR86 cluster bacterium TaxID=2030880 RepID=A0A2A5B0F2_9GAMM|nr:MAG: ABC transporter ATP-binding protein [SAR86 cluster bacterium]
MLHGIDIELRRGEVHAILGENGAGKSTLVKILSGFEPLTAGELQLTDDSGEKIHISQWNNQIAEKAGVVLIHQEFNLVDQLTVAENIFLGSEIKKGLFLDKKQMLKKTREYLQSLQCDIDPDVPVRNLAVSAKQMVEIAKAQAKHAKLLILDEPTAVLTQKESQVLFELIERLRKRGVAIVYISHKLDEIEQIADRITILRDGKLVGHYKGSELTKDDMARLMVGRELSSLFPDIPALNEESEVVLRIENLLLPGVDHGASFSLKRGEILGFSGLVGSGRTALMETVIGLRVAARNNVGSITINGEQLKFKRLADARKKGIAYLSKDRKGSGLLLDKGLSFNFSLFALQKFSRILIDKKQEQQAFDKAVDTFDIRIKDFNVNAGNLSGGNQQKLLLAKILEAEPAIIIIDEPTRGIDIGTKGQIYQFIAQLLAAGHSLILISSDITEIIGLSHRVAVMYHSEIVGVLEGEEINEHEIMRYATGLKTKPQKVTAEKELDKKLSTG